MQVDKWILCPLCGGKTRVKLREDTILENFPLYCPKCKQEMLIRANKLRQHRIIRQKEPSYQQIAFGRTVCA